MMHPLTPLHILHGPPTFLFSQYAMLQGRDFIHSPSTVLLVVYIIIDSSAELTDRKRKSHLSLLIFI